MASIAWLSIGKSLKVHRPNRTLHHIAQSTYPSLLYFYEVVPVLETMRECLPELIRPVYGKVEILMRKPMKLATIYFSRTGFMLAVGSKVSFYKDRGKGACGSSRLDPTPLQPRLAPPSLHFHKA
ncbi:hypothetical protein AVEN_38713-1 [Araneus ventricosus]|uniref:Uncharacterized protein n=1 Tax=Araneus ventricosus TaxID=182803 RepID=A0A4Y2GSR3_ARAVE|nr:hypothetical protein AVEN_38713-1 [Araneus ventricosus]